MLTVLGLAKRVAKVSGRNLGENNTVIATGREGRSTHLVICSTGHTEIEYAVLVCEKVLSNKGK